MRIVVCLSHPIQYKTPLLQALAVKSGTSLQVYYYSDRGLVEKKNEYHGGVPAWDIPLLLDYPYEFVPNWLNEEKWKLSAIQPFLNPKLICKLIAGNFDAIIIHSYQVPSDWLALLTAKRKRMAVLFYGDMYPRNQNSIPRKIAREFLHKPMINAADACLAIGSVAKKVFLEEYRVPESKIFLAPYAVNNSFFIDRVEELRSQKESLKSILAIPPEMPVVLCVASMVPKKRQQDLVEAMAKISTNARLVLVGHGPLLEEIRNFCKQILPETILTGFVNQTELPRYYAIADIFVLPSRWEEFGLVVNEAMCAGLPVITSTTVAAASDLVYEGENGFTFPAENIAALSEKISLLLENPDLRYRFGLRSLEIIQAWNYDSTVRGIFAALDFALENKFGMR